MRAVNIDLQIGLSEKQIAFRESLHEYDVTGYGGAKGGGKSAGARLVALLESLETPGCVSGLFRKTFPELRDNHIGPLFTAYPQLRPFWNSRDSLIRIPSLESELKFRYCATLADVDAQAGREYHKLFIEEAGDWQYECAIRLIRNCNRSTREGVKASAALMFNWGGIGHGWLKRIFWEKKLRENEKKLSWNFILAKVEDNPKLMEIDPGYLQRLEAEPNEALRKAHRHGDANIIAGQYFDIDAGVHLVKPFKIPTYWEWFGAYDYGYGHPAAWGWFAVDPQQNVFLVRSHLKARQSIAEQAAHVYDVERQLREAHQKKSMQTLFWAGHDCWATKKGGDPTIAEDFMSSRVVGKNYVTMKPANIARKLGASQLRNMLHWEMKGERREGPRFQVFDTEENAPVVDCVSRMVHNPEDVEDVLKVDAQDGDVFTGDDAYDMVRMAVMSRPISGNIPRKGPGTTYNDEGRERRASWQTV